MVKYIVERFRAQNSQIRWPCDPESKFGLDRVGADACETCIGVFAAEAAVVKRRRKDAMMMMSKCKLGSAPNESV